MSKKKFFIKTLYQKFYLQNIVKINAIIFKVFDNQKKLIRFDSSKNMETSNFL